MPPSSLVLMSLLLILISCSIFSLFSLSPLLICYSPSAQLSVSFLQTPSVLQLPDPIKNGRFFKWIITLRPQILLREFGVWYEKYDTSESNDQPLPLPPRIALRMRHSNNAFTSTFEKWVTATRLTPMSVELMQPELREVFNWLRGGGWKRAYAVSIQHGIQFSVWIIKSTLWCIYLLEGGFKHSR